MSEKIPIRDFYGKIIGYRREKLNGDILSYNLGVISFSDKERRENSKYNFGDLFIDHPPSDDDDDDVVSVDTIEFNEFLSEQSKTKKEIANF